MHRPSYILYFILLFILIDFMGSHAQEIRKRNADDSVLLIQPGMDSTLIAERAESIYLDEETLNRPKTAAFFSAAFPGLGQIYNNSQWKLPIIYGGFITMSYFINWNDKKYQQYRNALFDKINPTGIITNPLAQVGSVDALRKGVNYFRRNRDYLMILTAGLYLLQIAEAHVEAHLMEFDISEDLSANIEPHIKSYYPYSYSFGFSFIIKFN